MRRIAGAAFTAILLSSCAISSDEPPAGIAAAKPTTPWRPVDADTGRLREVADLEQLAHDFPNSGSVRLRLFSAQLGGDRPDEALASLEWLYERGYVFSDAAQQQIPGLLEGVDPGRIAERLRAAPDVIEGSRVVANIPEELHLVESVARGPDGRLYATSVVSEQLIVLDDGGEWSAVDLGDNAALTGIVVDDSEGLIWTASGDPGLGTEPLSGFRGLIGYDPESKEVRRRIAAPGDAHPSDIAIGADGTLYASDPLAGTVYRARSGENSLSVLVAPGTLRSPQGIAESANGEFLYVSDYRYGLALIDLESGRVDQVASLDTSLNLDGIDGLWRSGNDLVAVQNGSSPMRIVSLSLSDDGRSVQGVQILEQAHGDWTEPLGGSLVDGHLVYVGNGQWDRFTEGGAPDPDNPPVATQIRRLPIAQAQVKPPR